MWRFFILFGFFPFFLSAADLGILKVVPSGQDVQAGQQIVFTFNQPVVPLGRMERDSSEVPVRIAPALNCQWKWLDRSSLACQLDRKDRLKKATTYQIVVKAGLKTESGESLKKDFQHEFSTERLKVGSSYLTGFWSPYSPVVTLYFNDLVNRVGLEKLAYFEAEDGTKVPARLINTDRLYQIEKKKDHASFLSALESLTDSESTAWAFTSLVPLPPKKSFRLKLREGLQSKEGNLKGEAYSSDEEIQAPGEFEYLGAYCQTSDGKTKILKDETFEACLPGEGVSLVFSSEPVRASISNDFAVEVLSPEGIEAKDFWNGFGIYREDSHWTLEIYELEAQTSYQFKIHADKLTDEFGRKLSASSDPIVNLKTGDYKPYFDWIYSDSVLEKEVDTKLAARLVNMEALDLEYQSASAEGIYKGRKAQIRFEAPKNLRGKLPVDIRSLIPLRDEEKSLWLWIYQKIFFWTKEESESLSGAIKGEWKETPSVGDSNKDRFFFSQVTPFQVQAKMGHFESRVWVTRLSDGAPVSDARVYVYIEDRRGFKDSPKILVEVETDENGLAILPGVVEFDPERKFIPKNWDIKNEYMTLRVEKGLDLAFLPLVYGFRDYPYSSGEYIYSSTQKEKSHLRVWGMSAQGLYRPGDLIQFKLYVRSQDNQGLAPAPDGLYKVSVKDPFDKTVYSKENLALSEFGSFSDSLRLNDNAAMGFYSVYVETESYSDQAFRILVTDFKPSVFKAKVEAAKDDVEAGEEVEILSSAELYAGGPLAHAKYHLSLVLNPSSFRAKSAELRKFNFSSQDEPGWADNLFREKFKLSVSGTDKQKLKIKESDSVYGRVTVEAAVSDDQGRSIAAYDSLSFYGRDRFVGLQYDDWLMTSGQAHEVDVVVIDRDENFIEGVPVKVQLQNYETKMVRTKSSGEVFTQRMESEWVSVETCELVSAKAVQQCQFTPTKAGYYRIQAQIKDTKERSHISELYRYVSGSDYVMWSDTSGLELIPEKKVYKVGETARILVKNPYPGAYGHLSLERYGVLDSESRVFPNSTEIIEFPIKAEHRPGIYPSLTLFSPRQETEKKFGEDTKVDLGKPEMKSGYTKLLVEPAEDDLQIQISTNKQEYKPRETVELTIDIASRGEKEEKLELAALVLDESVFDLLLGGEKLFDPKKGLMRLEPLDVVSYQLLEQLVGQIAFDMKGKTQGGDGPEDEGVQYRNLIEYVAFWKPQVLAETGGRTVLSFSLPDNLTRWKVLVAAVSPSDLLQLSESQFVTSLPLEINALLPNQVLVNDEFEAGFKLLSRKESDIEVELQLEANGAIENAERMTKSFRLKSFEPQIYWLPLKATEVGSVKFKAQLSSTDLKDSIELELDVIDRQALESVAIYTTSDQGEEVPIRGPENAKAGSTELQLDFSPTLLRLLLPSFAYMKNYPYGCWEQRLSRALSALYFKDLKQHLGNDFQWDEAESAALKWIQELPSFQAPNGGMAYYKAEDIYADPYLSAYTLWALKEMEGREIKVDQASRDRLIGYLSKVLRDKTLFDKRYTKGLQASVRAMALSALSAFSEARFEDLLSLYEQRNEMSLFGRSLLWEALIEFQDPRAAALAAQLQEELYAQSERTSGRLIFQERRASFYKTILASENRTQCSLLSAILSLSEDKKEPGDSLLILRQLMKQGSGRGEILGSTQEVVFCQRAVADYAKKFESTEPDMALKISLAEKDLGERTLKGFQSTPESLRAELPQKAFAQTQKLKIEKTGVGRYYSRVGLSYEPKDRGAKDVNSGIEIRKELSIKVDGKWQKQDSPLQIQSGDLVRVDLFVNVPAERYFVVVSDPLPGGLEALNTQLATVSRQNASEARIEFDPKSYFHQFSGWRSFGSSRWSFYHKEIGFDEVNFYSEQLNEGQYHLRYMAQAIAPGEFSLPPARAEEMYAPEVYGETRGARVLVRHANP